jgi:hypothetical protein
MTVAGRARGDDSGVIDLAGLVQQMDAPAPTGPLAPATAELVCNEEDVEDVGEEHREAPSALIAASPAHAPSPAHAASPTPPREDHDERSSPNVELGVLAGVNQPRPPLRTRTRRRWMAAAAGVAALVLLSVAGYRARVHRPPPGATVTEPSAADRPPTTLAAAPAPAPAPTTTSLAADALPAAPSAIASAAPDRSARTARGPASPEPPPGEAAIALRDLPANAGSAEDLGDAMRRATDARGGVTANIAAPQGPAATTLRPAAGALNATIVNATRAARACLAADDPIVRATLTFAADGHATVRVGKVTSSLPGAEACVTAALGAAQVNPFVEAPLAVPVTVRP